MFQEAAKARRTDDEQYVDATSTPADREGIYDQPQAAADSVYTSLTVTRYSYARGIARIPDLRPSLFVYLFVCCFWVFVCFFGFF